MMLQRMRPLLFAAYPMSVFLIVYPIVNLMLMRAPLQPGSPGWRYATFATLVGSTTLPFIGFALGAAAAFLLDHVRTLRVLGALAVMLGAVVIAGTAAFVSDAATLRSAVPLHELARYDAAFLRALVIAASNVVVLCWFSWGAWRAGTPQRAGAQRTGSPQQADATSPLRGASSHGRGASTASGSA